MQKSNTLILHEGMNALKEKLGLVDSEKFISLILRDNFDSTNFHKLKHSSTEKLIGTYSLSNQILFDFCKIVYTEWQQNLWIGKSLREIHLEAKEYFESNN